LVEHGRPYAASWANRERGRQSFGFEDRRIGNGAVDQAAHGHARGETPPGSGETARRALLDERITHWSRCVPAALRPHQPSVTLSTNGESRRRVGRGGAVDVVGEGANLNPLHTTWPRCARTDGSLRPLFCSGQRESGRRKRRMIRGPRAMGTRARRFWPRGRRISLLQPRGGHPEVRADSQFAHTANVISAGGV